MLPSLTEIFAVQPSVGFLGEDFLHDKKWYKNRFFLVRAG